MNNNNSPLFAGNLREFAGRVLDTYSQRIAKDDVDTLFYMTVGSARLNRIAELTTRFQKVLIAKESSEDKAFFEAVLGDFGCGKSHIGYLLRHNALTCGTEMLVAHCQITGTPRFQGMMAAILRGLRISGVPSMVCNRIEISAYCKLAEWAGGSQPQLEAFIRANLGNLPSGAAADLAAAIKGVARPHADIGPLQGFLSNWVEQNDAKLALEVFEQVMRLFTALGVQQMFMIVDEFEALSTLPAVEQSATIQQLQCLHDDFASIKELPRLHAIFLSTNEWWNRGAAAYPALLQVGDRTRLTSDIPNVTKVDIFGLLERYVSLFLLRSGSSREITYEAFQKACDQCWSQLAGKTHHMRSVHDVVRRNAESLIVS